jgi:hypothetical protein
MKTGQEKNYCSLSIRAGKAIPTFFRKAKTAKHLQPALDSGGMRRRHLP